MPLLLQRPGDLAGAIDTLPAPGPLPLRTVLVPSERHAHTLRRALLRGGHATTLAGTRIVGPATLAEEIVLSTGRAVRLGEASLRPARLRALIESGIRLEHYPLDLLRSTPGWPEAFASAIGELEAAGLRPDLLPATSARWRDLAVVWRALEAAAGPSWTHARLYLEAAALLEAGTRLPTGPILARVTGREQAAQARFLRALPDLTLAVQAVRPLRDRHLARLEALFGPAARQALEQVQPPPEGPTERDLLARHLFASPQALADPKRARSRGPDGTVALEEHAGVEAELTAAAEWVAHEIHERRTPLEAIAVLAPARDPLVPLLAARLARLELPSGPLPLHIAGGLPLSSTAAGARAAALLRALAGHLPAAEVAALLPGLRAALGERSHISISEATTLAWSLGTLGGSSAHPAGALDWSARAAAREAALASQLAALAADGGADDRAVRGVRDAFDALRAARPALDALTGLAVLLVERRPLSELATALLGFLEAWLLQPGSEVPVQALLRDALGGLDGDTLASDLRGLDALAHLEARLAGLRVPTARFGTPAVFVGTLGDADGLDFEAVRVLGLCEGALPSSPREDPILPDRMRDEVAPLLLPTSADRALAQLQVFDQVVRGIRRAIVLSSPRSDVERTEREAASILVEVGAALGRPDASGPGSVIPDLAALQRTAFGPARDAVATLRMANPLTTGEWLDRAVVNTELPASWSGAPHLDLTTILEQLGRTQLGPGDGLLGTAGPLPTFPGLGPERPTSASALGTLLGCPLRFLHERVLHWKEPAAGAPVAELDPLTYGSLFHAVMERFAAAHGEPFVKRVRTLAHWGRAAASLAEEAFADLAEEVAFVGPAAKEHQLQRLLRDLASFLDYDWRLELTRFVAAEQGFGRPDPLLLDAGGVRLHLRGDIDRLDVEGRHLLLRDYKTGRDHPRLGDEEGPTLGRDLQLGLYGLAARALARNWEVPKTLEVAYVYPRSGEERAFRDDYGALESATRDWLAVGAALLAGGLFPPTPEKGDCRFCAFSPLCGDEVPARAAASVGHHEVVDAFLTLKRGEVEE